MLRSTFFLLMATALMASCSEPAEPVGLSKPSYFDLENLLDGLQKQLAQSGAAAKKTSVNTSGQTEVQTLQQVNWQRELEMFSQAAINRPAWRGEFEIDSLRPNGHLTLKYSRKKGSNAPVEYLQVEHSATGDPQKITARISSNNMLYGTSKLLELQLNSEAPNRLRKYRVSGVQKLVLSDSVHYQMLGEVIP